MTEHRHYVDNQGFCHSCGKPMEMSHWLLYCGTYGEATEWQQRRWDSLIRDWKEKNDA